MDITGSSSLKYSSLRSGAFSPLPATLEKNKQDDVEKHDQAMNFNNRSQNSDNALERCKHSAINVQIDDSLQISSETNRLRSSINLTSIKSAEKVQPTDSSQVQEEGLETLTEEFQSLRIKYPPGAEATSSQREINSFSDKQRKQINLLFGNLNELIREIDVQINNGEKSVEIIHKLLDYEEGIDTLYNIKDVRILVSRLTQPFKNSRQNEAKILWKLADKIAGAFLEYNFISASTISEIFHLKPLMQINLQKKVENKFQRMLDLTIRKINVYLESGNNGPEIFPFLQNLYILIKYICPYPKRESNLLRIINNLSGVIQYASMRKENFQRKLIISASRILNEIFSHEYSHNFYLFEFGLPLQKLFERFSIFEYKSDDYLNYLTHHTQQDLIYIYKSSSFYRNKENYSELESSKLDDWYIKLREYYKIINDGKINKIKFIDIKNIANKFTDPEKKLFLFGLYKNLISDLLRNNRGDYFRQQAFDLLETILNEDGSLITRLDIFKDVVLSTEENFFWINELPKTKQRVTLDNWIKNISNEENDPYEFLTSLKCLLSKSIFTAPLNFNYLIKHAKRKMIKNIRQKIGSAIRLKEMDIRCSAFRFFRHMRSAMDGVPPYRNIASMKYLDENGKAFYLIGYSMGKPALGKITLPPQLIAGNDWPLKRGHSEAKLLATHEIGCIEEKGSGRILNLANLKREYFASTNEPCSTGENCKGNLLPSLPPGRYANEYKSPEDNDGFMHKLDAHRWRKQNDEFYESEVDSEEECEAFVLENAYFEGLDLTNGQERAPVPAWRFHDYIKEKDPDYSKKYLERSVENKYFSGYVNFSKNGDEVSLIQKDEQIVKLDIKKGSKVDELDGEIDLATAINNCYLSSISLSVLETKFRSLLDDLRNLRFDSSRREAEFTPRLSQKG